MEQQLAQAKARIADLERMYRWFVSSADIIAALGDFQSNINIGLSPEIILRDARNYMSQLLPAKAVGFMSAENDDFDFRFVEVMPEDSRAALEAAVERAIADGTFGWAIQQNRPVVSALAASGQSLLLHTVGARSRVWGMCVAILHAKDDALSDVSMQLVSMVLMNAANALESHRLNGLVQDYNRDLEKAVEARTVELIEARKAAEAASEAKSDFLANVSHELRTPLNAIIGYTEILSDEVREEDGSSHWLADLQKIYRSSKHLLELIDDILDISRIETGQLEIVREPFQLGNLMRHLIASVRPLAGEQGNVIELDVDINPDIVVTDRLRLRQAVLNLLSNACKFTHQGRVTVTVRDERVETKRWVSISVTDTGIGINPDNLQKIFEPFTQAERSNVKRYRGTGLGLTITKRLCDMLGGRVDVTSQRGKGSTFTLHIPVDTD